MLDTLIVLVTAHLVADFALQSDAMVARKREIQVLLLHVAIVAGVSAVLLGWLAWPILGWIAITHFIADFAKARLGKRRLIAFAVDQAAHFAVIVLLALRYPDAAAQGIWSLLPPDPQRWFFIGIAVIGALLAATRMGGIVIGLILKPLVTSEIAELKGLKDGGLYIGWLERALIVLFVVMGEPAGVGLLLAAKSILRFGDIKDTEDRARAEYIMIGTFLSVAWALPIAATAHKAIAAIGI